MTDQHRKNIEKKIAFIEWNSCILVFIDPWHKSSVTVKLKRTITLGGSVFWIFILDLDFVCDFFSLIQSKTAQCSVPLQFSLRLSCQFYNMVRQ